MENINVSIKEIAFGISKNQDKIDLFLWYIWHGDFFSQGQVVS